MSKRPTWTRFAGLGFELAAAVAGLTFFGYWLGGYYGNAALGMVIGAILGVLGGMYNLIRASLAASGKTQRRTTDSNDS